jgi:NADH-quinone oxidoreductase subunit N
MIALDNFPIFNIYQDFILVYQDELINLVCAINIEKVIDFNLKYDAAFVLKTIGGPLNYENMAFNSANEFVGNTYCYYNKEGEAIYEQLWSAPQFVLHLFELSKDESFFTIFVLNFILIKLFFFDVTALNFWIVPQIILFFGGLLTFLLIKTQTLNLNVWDLTYWILVISFFYQLKMVYVYVKFFNTGISLKVGLGGLFKIPFNLFLVKLCAYLLILAILIITVNTMKRIYLKTLYLVKPELCSLTLFLGFGSGMVFLQNDLFSIFLYLEIVSFCIYGFLFLQQWNNSQLHGLIRYVLFSLWMASFYILGVTMYLSWSNFNTNLSYFTFNELSEYSNVNITSNNSKIYGYLNIELVFSIFFFLIYFLFKLGSAPFYTWVVDVYNSCSTGVLFLVSVLPKLIYFPILIFLLFFNFIIFYVYWSNLLFIFGLMTVFVGSMGILLTDKLKEIYSWSSILHTGNILLILSCISLNTLSFCFFYLISYTILSFGFLCVIMSLWNWITGRFIKTTIELSSINYLPSGFILVSMIMLSSAAGFTPMLSFFMKFSLFSIISLNYGIIFAIIIGVLNIIGSIAYLKMLRNMIGYNITPFSFRKKIKPYSPLVLDIDYNTGLILNILCVIVCFGFLFYNEFLYFFSYNNNFAYMDTLSTQQIYIRILYNE